MIESSSLSDTIIDDCAERIRHGASLDDCLNAYPSLAHELEPLLTIMFQAPMLPVPKLRPEVRARVRRQMLQAVRSRQAKPQGWFRTPLLRFALAFVATFFALGSGLAAAQTSLPDSPLYGVKRAGEELRLQLTSDPKARAGLYLEYSEVRFNEIVALSNAGRPVPESLLDQCAEQRDLAWQTIVDLEPSAEGALQQRYVSMTEHRIAALSTGPLAQSPVLEQFLAHEQAALNAAQQHPVDSGPEKPNKPPGKPAATETVPVQTRTPKPEPTHAKPTARPDNGNNGNNGNPGKPTAQPEPRDTGKPTAQPDNSNNGNPGNNGKPTAQPDNGNNGNNGNNGDTGKPTAQPDNGNNGNNGNNGDTGKPTAQPDNGNNGNNGDTGKPTAQPDNGNNGNNGNPASQPETSEKSGNNSNSTNEPVHENKSDENKGKHP